MEGFKVWFSRSDAFREDMVAEGGKPRVCVEHAHLTLIRTDPHPPERRGRGEEEGVCGSARQTVVGYV